MIFVVRRIKKFLREVLFFVFYALKGLPAKNMKLIGVTGTSGKSTTTTIIFFLLKNLGMNAGMISTIGAYCKEDVVDTGLHTTTPDPLDIVKLLFLMKKNEIEYLVIEASSHALDQGRLGILKFDFSVFTNIAYDHLDYHFTWENYAAAKSRLISKLKKEGKVLLNADDRKSFEFLKRKLNNKSYISYSKAKEVTSIKQTGGILSFFYKEQYFEIGIFGEYNIENVLPAIKIGEYLGFDLKKISEALKNYKLPEGRMELMYNKNFRVIIDFAHNADSLKRSLLSARSLVKGDGRLITVLGSAGLRDREKRFEMGRISGELSDFTIVTSEDPRTESLYGINSKIIAGAESAGATLIKRFENTQEYKNFLKKSENIKQKSIFAFDQESVDSRFDAIEFAIKIAEEGDVIITQGKGHEQSLCFGKQEYPFSDHLAVKKALKNYV